MHSAQPGPTFIEALLDDLYTRSLSIQQAEDCTWCNHDLVHTCRTHTIQFKLPAAGHSTTAHTLVHNAGLHISESLDLVYMYKWGVWVNVRPTPVSPLQVHLWSNEAAWRSVDEVLIRQCWLKIEVNPPGLKCFSFSHFVYLFVCLFACLGFVGVCIDKGSMNTHLQFQAVKSDPSRDCGPSTGVLVPNVDITHLHLQTDKTTH